MRRLTYSGASPAPTRPSAEAEFRQIRHHGRRGSPIRGIKGESSGVVQGVGRRRDIAHLVVGGRRPV